MVWTSFWGAGHASGGAAASSFVYDGDGNRVSQTVGTGTYSYVNDVATALPVVLQESGPDGNISYAYGLGLISESSSAFSFFYHPDGLGSVVGLTDPAGRLKGRYVYDAWGQADLSVPAPQIGTGNKFRFTGEALDPGTGLYYLRARYYDSSVGRLLTRDPLSGVSSFPLSKSRYPYAFDNPVRYTDPSGLSALGFLEFAGNFIKLVGTAERAQPINERLAACYNDVGTCQDAPQLLLGRQQILQEAVGRAGDAAVSAVDVIYSPSVSGVSTSDEFKLFDIGVTLLKNWEWLKALFQIPTARAAGPDAPLYLADDPSAWVASIPAASVPSSTPSGK